MFNFRLIPITFTSIYAFAGFAWISFSDRIINYCFTNPLLIQTFSLYKSWFLIIASSFVLFIVFKKLYLTLDNFQKHLEDSRSRFNSLFQSHMIGIILCDKEGRVKDANNAFLMMLGYTSEDLASLNLKALTPGEYGEQDDEKLFELRQKKVVTPYAKEYFKKDGTRLPLLVGMTYLDKEEQMVLSVVVDTTEQKQDKEKLKKMNQELKTFIYRASHDLKGPLASTIGLVNVAMLEVTEDKALKYFDLLKGTMTKLDHNLMSLLRFMEVKEKSLEISEIDFCQVIDKAIHGLKKTDGFKALEWRVNLKGNIKFHSDQELIFSIIYNLLENAVKFRSPYRESCYCSIEVQQEADSSVMIEIEDNGIGIQDEHRDKIFEMFFRGANSTGSGLGLYIVRNGIEKLGGKIKVSAPVAGGSRFQLQLPDAQPVLVPPRPMQFSHVRIAYNM